MILEELQTLLDEHYGIGNLTEFSQLKGGYWNQTLKLAAKENEYVLRIGPPARTKAESVSYQHKLMKFMNRRIPEVPLPVAGKTGATFFIYESKIISLFPFMKGEMTTRKKSRQQLSAAKMLAELHRAGIEFPDKSLHPNYQSLENFNREENSNRRWSKIENLLEGSAENLKKLVNTPIGEKTFECVDEIISRKSQIREERDKAGRQIAELKNSHRRLLSAPIHGDYYPSNLLAVNDEISAVLDWDECQSEWLSYELGRAVWEFCRYDEKAVMNSENARAFLQAYKQAGGIVPESEFDLLVPFIRLVRIREVLFSLGEAINKEFWEPEYTLYNLEALDNLTSAKSII